MVVRKGVTVEEVAVAVVVVPVVVAAHPGGGVPSDPSTARAENVKGPDVCGEKKKR